ncbi:uncharacterized protein LOC144082058 isoform X2 [Stigmatopora argus]
MTSTTTPPFFFVFCFCFVFFLNCLLALDIQPIRDGGGLFKGQRWSVIPPVSLQTRVEVKLIREEMALAAMLCLLLVFSVQVGAMQPPRPVEKTCWRISKHCPTVYDPICGSDGRTYSSECVFCQQHGVNPKVKVLYKGECKSCAQYGPFCTKILDPVCGNDGHTYPNECVFCQQNRLNPNAKVSHKGNCNNCDEYGLFCPKLYDPVCGSDWRTYDNECFLCLENRVNNKKLTVERKGECDACSSYGQFCQTKYEPVCGSDGLTYDSECFLCQENRINNKKLTVKHTGECDACSSYGQFCQTKYEPVCGSDGLTYDSECFLCQENRLNNKKLMVEHKGECEPDDACKAYGQFCLKKYDPVCGSDGVTYDNECFLCQQNRIHNKKLMVEHKGECEPDDACKAYGQFCLKKYDPVCGSDGVTYDNECFLCQQNRIHNKKLMVEHKGECDACKSYAGQFCHKIYKPVCGSDGVTYDNECFLCLENRVHNKKLMVEHKGECKTDDACKSYGQFCPEIYDPVCASDGRTYDNECFLCLENRVHNKKLTVEHKGECKSDACKSYGLFCPKKYDPVCGSDGVTYDNECFLCKENRVHNKKLTVKHKGECNACNSYGQFCPEIYDPVCASDGRTYDNECFLCKENRVHNKKLNVEHTGECEILICTAEYDPVCGTDGRTYPNDCGLRRQNSGNGEVKVAYKGECAKNECERFGKFCQREWAPVCGTDGRTYPNECILCKENRRHQKKVKVAQKGWC